MPTRNLYLRAPNEELELIIRRDLADPENNIFEKTFHADMDMEEWDDWMNWEGGATEFVFPEDRMCVISTISSPERWPINQDNAKIDPISHSYSAPNDFLYEDASFELAESPVTSKDLPLGTISTQDFRRPLRGFSTLTEAEERDLQDIAMPCHMPQAIKIEFEPLSPTTSHSSPEPEPETRTRQTKKRKSSIDVPSALYQSRKKGHNAIEKRYRTNLNDKINCLRQGIPSINRQSNSDSKSDFERGDSEGEIDKALQQKYGKAAILTRALEYIKHLETTTQRLGSEVNVLKTRVGAFEKLAMSGSIILNAKGLSAVSGQSLVKSETLENIQADFKQIKFKPKVATEGVLKRRSSKPAKI